MTARVKTAIRDNPSGLPLVFSIGTLKFGGDPPLLTNIINSGLYHSILSVERPKGVPIYDRRQPDSASYGVFQWNDGNIQNHAVQIPGPRVRLGDRCDNDNGICIDKGISEVLGGIAGQIRKAPRGDCEDFRGLNVLVAPHTQTIHHHHPAYAVNPFFEEVLA